MQLFILRHGDAPFDSKEGERTLSPTGVKETETVVATKANELETLSHIICSPSRRARETLAVLNKTLKLNVKLIIDDCVRSESSVSKVEQFFDRLAHNEELTSVLLISHQPLVGSLYRYLLDQPDDHYFLGTSNLVNFSLSTFFRGCGELNWIESP